MTALTADPRAPAPDLPSSGVSMSVEGAAVDRTAAWRFLGDTDWYNRLVGNGRVMSMAMRTTEDGLPVFEGTLSGPGGLKLPFHEAWMSWERERYFRQVRRVDSPFLRGTDWVGWLTPGAAGKVVPHVQLTLFGPTWTNPIFRGALARIRERTAEALARIEAPDDPVREIPPSALVAVAAWAREAGSALVDPIVAHLRTARPTEVVRMRAFALADQWGKDREQVLETFLHGVAAGVVELYWTVRCRRCYGAVGGGTSLSDVSDHAECPACRLSFGTDLGENVEVVFAPHPSVFPRSEERFCTLYPAAAPEQHGVWTLAPGQALETEATLVPGEWRLGAAGRGVDRPIRIHPQGPQAALEWAADGPDLLVEAGAGTIPVRLANHSDHRQRVYLTRLAGEEPRVMASLLTNRPAFRRRFGHQVLARDVRVSVRAVTLLFTDLSGSTAMYEELGDAQAFAVVRDHFTLLREAVEAERGVVVKTIGDAVMASFHEPDSALRAALAMATAFARWRDTLHLSRPLGLKVGLHLGPALAVHSDQSGLDWFGGTVNLAARTQGAAESGEVMLTGALAADPRAAAVLAERGLDLEPVDKELKGLGATRLWRTRAPLK